MGKEGFPVIVTGEAPYRVLLGFMGKAEKLSPLAERIRVENKTPKVICEKLNEDVFKFDADDTYAAEKIAPFLGKISLCLEKGLALYENTGVNGEEAAALKNKISVLTKNVEELANEGLTLTENRFKNIHTLSECLFNGSRYKIIQLVGKPYNVNKYESACGIVISR
jgi:hypothetical protein